MERGRGVRRRPGEEPVWLGSLFSIVVDVLLPPALYVFDEMFARKQTLNFYLIFGVLTSDRDGVLVRCLGCQGEVLWCTKWEWSSDVLFLNSNFENLI